MDFTLQRRLPERDTAAFKFSTRKLKWISRPPPIPVGPFCGCLMHLATLDRYLPRGEGRGRDGSRSGRLLSALTQREPPSPPHENMFPTWE